MTITCFKIQYETKGAARAAAAAHHWKRSRRTGRRYKRRGGGAPNGVYQCPYCGFWHITSKA